MHARSATSPSKIQNTKESRLGALLAMASLAFCAGVAWIVVESVLIARYNPAVSWGELAASLGYEYGVVFALAGILLLLAIMGLGFVLGKRQPSCALRLSLSAFFPAMLFVLLGYYVNEEYLPYLFSAKSLAANGGMIAGAVVLGLLLGFLIFRPWLARILQKPVAWIPLLILTLLLAVAVPLLGALDSPASPGINAGSRNRVPGSGPPGIVFILIDTLRADHLGCYGYERSTSPNLDAIADEALLFDQAIAQSSWTRPSTASIFTSRYPSGHGANVLNQRIPESLVTLPEALQDWGYTTGVFSANANVSRLFGFGQGVDRFYNTYEAKPQNLALLQRLLLKVRSRVPALGRLLPAGEGTTPEDLQDDDEQVYENGQAWLGENDGGPFFLYLHFMAPHTPYDPPAPFREQFLDREPEVDLSDHPDRPDIPITAADPLPPEQREAMVALYDGEIAYIDSVMGRLRQHLEEKGLWDDSLVVITSDHGEEFYEHGSWGHGQSTYDELIRVPLIIKRPREDSPGTLVHRQARLVDLYPTILEVIGAGRRPSGLVGDPVLPLDGGDDEAPEPLAFTEVLTNAYEIHSARTPAHKVMETRVLSGSDQPDPKHYRLAEDPGETAPQPVADSEEGAALMERLKAFQSGSRREGEDVAIDAETLNQLKALGYVGE